ncbi:MAG TPA: hypothetical protein VN457_07820 [Chlamydiales bacterium]|nr:hypothetical protein [Chlamydiales bacterium]
MRLVFLMLSIQQMLKIDPELVTLSEGELEEVRTAFYDAAQLAFDVYWAKKHGSKNPRGLLTSNTEDATL